MRLASELECGGLILVSPYTSVKDLVSQHAGIITSWLTAELADLFPSDEFIQDVQCPTLIVHGAPIHTHALQLIHPACRSRIVSFVNTTRADSVK